MFVDPPLTEGEKNKKQISLNMLCKGFVLLAISFERTQANSITVMNMHLWSNGYDVSLTR